MTLLLVYVREAHAIDSPSPMARVLVEAPVTIEERRKVASTCVARLDLPMPAMLDRIDDAVDQAWQAWPDRLCLIGKNGRITHAGGRGPGGFTPDEIEDAILDELSRLVPARRKR